MTAKNKIFEKKRKEQIDQLTLQLSAMLPKILTKYTFNDDDPLNFKAQQSSLNAIIGGKHKTYINVTDDVIASADEFAAMWFRGMINYIQTVDKGREKERAAYKFQQMLCKDQELMDYTVMFLKRTYLRNYYSLSKRRPSKDEAALWIGQNNANYGLLITPRFKNGEWENDVSEIRHFQPDYWTIGHIMKTGFVVPHMFDKIEFNSIEQYLSFFKNTIVRQSGSPYEMKIAERYCSFVRNHKAPYQVPLLIPELRYGGIDVRHKYRLDFTIINPYTLQKQGFEFSPWSTHGCLAGINRKSSKEINAEARVNFEKEMQKHKDYYRKHNIFTLIYTDVDLQDMDKVFEEMEIYLRPERENRQLLEATIDEFKDFQI